MHSLKDWLTGQWVWPIILVLVVGLAVLLRAPMLQHLEWQLYDRGLRLARSPGADVSLALVEIDARSLAGQAEDLRTQLARLIHLLRADGARGVGLVLPLYSAGGSGRVILSSAFLPVLPEGLSPPPHPAANAARAVMATAASSVMRFMVGSPLFVPLP